MCFFFLSFLLGWLDLSMFYSSFNRGLYFGVEFVEFLLVFVIILFDFIDFSSIFK